MLPVCFPLLFPSSAPFFYTSPPLSHSPFNTPRDKTAKTGKDKRGQRANENKGITYSHASGTQSVDDKSPLQNKPFGLDTTMWIASCTKLLTSLAALQCVERGLLKVDEDISRVIPELKPGEGMKVLDGFKKEGDKEVPQYKENTKPITLRHLLSHSSGLAYAAFDPQIQAVYEAKGMNWQVTSDSFVSLPHPSTLATH